MALIGPINLTLFADSIQLLSSRCYTSPNTMKTPTATTFILLFTPLSSSLSHLQNLSPFPLFLSSSTILLHFRPGKPLGFLPGPSELTQVAAISTRLKLTLSPRLSIPSRVRLSPRITPRKSTLWSLEPQSHLGSSPNSFLRARSSLALHPFSGARRGSTVSGRLGIVITTWVMRSPRFQ